MTAKKTPLVRKVHTIDANGKVLGRLATRVATILRGKHKVTFVPNQDEGDFVKIQNIKSLTITGLKMEQKVYHSYSGYPGGMKVRLLKDEFVRRPGWVLTKAVERMLPNNRLRKGMLKRLIIE